jgi:basic membrane protein A
MPTRRDLLKASGVGLTISLAGCSTQDRDGGGGDAEYNVAMIYALGGTGDESFSDAANAGINEATEMFDMAFDDAGPQSSSEFDEFQTQFARSDDPNYDLIICLGFEHVPPLAGSEDTDGNADEFSDQNWALLDASIDTPNAECWVYAANEGAYVAGEAAATLSSQEFSAGAGTTDPSETTLGFVGGVEVPPVQTFEAGFRAGMKSVSDEFELLTGYVGGFDNPGDVEETARSMIDNGADVLLHGAGAGGSGLFQACQDRGRFAFGADSRQSETAADFSDVILGSIIKGVDQSVINAVERVVNGEFEGGQTFELSAGEGGFTVPWGVEIGDDIPQEVKDQADQTIQAIADGDIDVPDLP